MDTEQPGLPTEHLQAQASAPSATESTLAQTQAMKALVHDDEGPVKSSNSGLASHPAAFRGLIDHSSSEQVQNLFLQRLHSINEVLCPDNPICVRSNYLKSMNADTTDEEMYSTFWSEFFRGSHLENDQFVLDSVLASGKELVGYLSVKTREQFMAKHKSFTTTDGMIQWVNYVFEPHVAGPKSLRRPAGDIIKSDRELSTSTVEHHGVSMVLPANFCESKDGIKNFDADLSTMSDSLMDTLNYEAINKLIKMALDYQFPSAMTPFRSFMDMQRYLESRYNEKLAVHKDGSATAGFPLVAGTVVDNLITTKRKPDLMLVNHRIPLLDRMLQQHNINRQIGDKDGKVREQYPVTRPGGTSNPMDKNYFGMAMVSSRKYNLANEQPHDPTEQTMFVSEYYTMLPPRGIGGLDDYSSTHRTISIVDLDENKLHDLTLQHVVAASGMFDEVNPARGGAHPDAGLSVFGQNAVYAMLASPKPGERNYGKSRRRNHDSLMAAEVEEQKIREKRDEIEPPRGTGLTFWHLFEHAGIVEPVVSLIRKSEGAIRALGIADAKVHAGGGRPGGAGGPGGRIFTQAEVPRQARNLAAAAADRVMLLPGGTRAVLPLLLSEVNLGAGGDARILQPSPSIHTPESPLGRVYLISQLIKDQLPEASKNLVAKPQVERERGMNGLAAAITIILRRASPIIMAALRASYLDIAAAYASDGGLTNPQKLQFAGHLVSSSIVADELNALHAAFPGLRAVTPGVYGGPRRGDGTPVFAIPAAATVPVVGAVASRWSLNILDKFANEVRPNIQYWAQHTATAGNGVAINDAMTKANDWVNAANRIGGDERIRRMASYTYAWLDPVIFVRSIANFVNDRPTRDDYNANRIGLALDTFYDNTATEAQIQQMGIAQTMASMHSGIEIGAPGNRPSTEAVKMMLKSMRITLKNTNLLIDNNIPVPFGFILVRPRIRLRVGGALFMRSGDRSATVILDHTQMGFAYDSANNEVRVNMNFDCGIAVVDPRSLKYKEGVTSTDYLGGGGVEIQRIGVQVDAESEASMWAVPVSYNYTPMSWLLSATGAFSEGLCIAPPSMSEAATFRAAYNSIFPGQDAASATDLQANAFTPEDILYSDPNVATLLSRGGQHGYNPNLKQHVDMRSGTSPLGITASPMRLAQLKGRNYEYGGSDGPGIRGST